MHCWARSQTGYQRTCTPSLEASHCNEIWPLLRYELAKTSWSSSKDMDTADWRRNNNQLETDVAECRGACTSWRAVAMDHSRLCVMMMMMIIQLLKQIKQFRQISSCTFYNLEHFLSSLYIHLGCTYRQQADKKVRRSTFDWYGVAIPNFGLVWPPPYLPYRFRRP